MLAGFAFVVATFAQPKPLPVVGLQPLGSVRQADLAIAKSAVESFYKVRVLVLKPRALPGSAYYAPRDRYRAEKLLVSLNDERESGCLKILGLTASDVSTEARGVKDWGIFGLGNLSGSACVISTYRMGRGSVSSREFSIRLANVVRHELGHTFGLPHCPTPGCVMADAGGSIKTISGHLYPLCGSCRVKIGSDLVR